MATLADYEDAIDEIPAGGGSYGNDLKTLPDGEYEFEIASGGAAYKSIEKTGSELVELKLTLLSENPRQQGKKFNHAYWLTNKNDGGLNEVTVGILKKDLKTLGFDVDNWTKANGRPFFGELKKALKILNGGGFAFKAKKATKDKYAHLYINSRSETDGRPATFDAKSMEAAAKEPFNADEY